LNGMFGGDFSRKKNLVENGFRLPSAFDNRPLKFPEFEAKVNKVIYTSATPGDYEKRHSENSGIIEQIIRPTGLVDPEIIIKPITGQVDDLIERIKKIIERNERVLVTTLTKKMAEDLTEYLNEQILCSKGGFKNMTAGTKLAGKRINADRIGAINRVSTTGENIAEYLHSEVNTIERVKILEDLRKGKFAVLVGVNLLREGLDLPEVSLVAILDADKEGFLRSETSLIQTIGRAARNVRGQVIFYADNITGSMKRAIDETDRRRKIQLDYNKKHHITPRTIKKEIKSIIDHELKLEVAPEFLDLENLELKDIPDLIKIKEEEMRHLAENLEFEKAALMRDEINQLRRIKI
ncbi:MAG: helicase-related protein, partial [bacterium]